VKTRRISRSIGAVLAAAFVVGGMPGPARAVVPGVGQNYANLMRRSLSVGPESVRLKILLATQRTAFAERVTGLAKAKGANTTAQTRLTAATTADTSARDRHAAAKADLSVARKALDKALRQKPRSNKAVTKAQNAVTAATKTAAARRAQTQVTATALTTARTGAATATAGLNDAITGWKVASVAVRQTQLKITNLGTAERWLDKATVVSRDVVTQTRAGFRVADTTTVYGVTVNKIVAFPFQRMVDDAQAAGISISGGGFRTRERQIELRKINGCPDIWTAPASSCRVPTAIPGRSLHEIGLAIDISSGGRTINAKTPAFAWLVANAGRYGFVNLPSEAWHWSITGG